MKELSRVLDAIGDEAAEEADKIAQNAEKESRRIQMQYEQKARERRKEIIRTAEKKAAQIRQRSISHAGTESRNLKLCARHRILDEVLKRTEEKLTALDTNEKKTLYERIIAGCSSDRNITVTLNEKDARQIGTKLKVRGRNITIDSNAGSFSGGLIIKEKNTETDCTFHIMVETAGRQMESELAAVLFS